MANLDRDTYEPTNIHPFDSEEDVDGFDEGSRLPLLIVIALIVLAAFAGVVWLAYTQGVERGRADAPRMAAVASQSAAPRTPSTPYTGLKIYQQPAAEAADAGNTDTVPPPPTPLAASKTSSAPPPLRPSANATAETPASTQEIPSPAPPKPAVPSQTVAQALPTHAPAKIASPSAAPAPSAPAAAASGPAGIFLQIGSYKSEAEARQSWAAFKARHAIAAGYQPDVRKAELGAKGTWYRLRLGTFANRQSAAALCEKLRSDGASCLLAR